MSKGPEGLAEIPRSKFIDLAWGSELKDILKQEKLNTRNLYEISSATTQCNNVIGPCNDNRCICWICGTPIFLTDQGNPWSPEQLKVYNDSGRNGTRNQMLQHARSEDKNKSIMNILPQCEHILPVMQAFFILGGLYWSETIAKESKQFKERIKKEYAWSHAYCNNLKDETNFFDDKGEVQTKVIEDILVKIYTNVLPIKNYLIRQGKTDKNKWANEQIANMTRDKLSPLISEYKNIMANPLLWFSSVVTPVQHVENALRGNLPETNARIMALDQMRPEWRIIPPLTIPEWRKRYTIESRRREIPDTFIKSVKDELKMKFIKNLINELYYSATNRKQKDIVNQFIMGLFSNSSYLEKEGTLRRDAFERNLESWYSAFLNTYLMTDVDINLIAALVNSPLVEQEKESYLITLVQTLALLNLLKMIDPNIVLEHDKYANLRNAVKNDKTGLLTSFVDSIKEYFATAVVLLTNKEIFSVNLPLTQYILGNLSLVSEDEIMTEDVNPFATFWARIFPNSKGITDKLLRNSFIDEEITPENERINAQLFRKILGITDKSGLTKQDVDRIGVEVDAPDHESMPIISKEPETMSTEDTQIISDAKDFMSLQRGDSIGEVPGPAAGYKGGKKRQTRKRKRSKKTRHFKKKHKRRQTLKKKKNMKRRTAKK